MMPGWERVAAAPSFVGAALFMDAVLRPHRSLSLTAFKTMLIAVIAINLVVGAVFIAQGAFPVAGFLGLDVLALWLAFRWNYRAGRVEERVCVARDQLYVAAIDPNGRAVHWVLNPLWARVMVQGKGVVIRAGANQLRLGAFLPPEECESFAAALRAALYRAARGA